MTTQSFRAFATLEWELLELGGWHTRNELTSTPWKASEVRYNRQRRYSTLGYISPAEYKTRLPVNVRTA